MYDPWKHHRRSIRLPGYDYSHPGMYYLTVCTFDRRCLFGEVIDGQMRRNTLGDIVHEEWYRTPAVRREVQLDAYIVMPNHIHGILVIIEVGATPRVALGGASPRPYISLPETTRYLALDATPHRPSGPVPGSVGAIVGQVKSVTKKRINRLRGTPGREVWQRDFYEHIIRNEGELDRIREYICNNPLRWVHAPRTRRGRVTPSTTSRTFWTVTRR